ncbi:helix-turn-helix domain-containing protein [Streptomyces sp. bgisy153]|uniref:helix-turn-helix domain-containing protein n=1 Tax=Streptomyces sp. bgisy153 TaxID=3413793 RepID=UPI003D70DA40
MPARHFDGQRVRAERRAKNLTQKQLAQAIGLKTHAPVASWESGKSFPDGEKLPGIAEALGKDLDELFPRDGAPTLRDLREDAGYPQNKTGQLIGVTSHIPVSNAERGMKRLDDEYVPRLAKAYGVTEQQLLDAQDRSFGVFVPAAGARGQETSRPRPETLAEKLSYLDKETFSGGQSAPTDADLAAVINRRAGAPVVAPADIAALRAGKVTETTPVIREGLGEAYGVSPMFFQDNDEVALQVVEGISFLAARERGDILGLAARGNDSGLSGAALAKINDLIAELGLGKGSRAGGEGR